MKILSSVFLGAILLFGGCSPQREYPGEKSTNPESVTSSGLRIMELEPGSGEASAEGDTVSVHYTGYLIDGKKFDSSLDRNAPLRFILGSGRVIRGWEEGILGMKVNQKRKLIIPPQLAYGERGFPPVIPGNAELVFDIQLVGVGKRESELTQP